MLCFLPFILDMIKLQLWIILKEAKKPTNEGDDSDYQV